MAHFADFDGAKIDSRNILRLLSDFYTENLDKINDMNWSKSDQKDQFQTDHICNFQFEAACFKLPFGKLTRNLEKVERSTLFCLNITL